MMGIYIKGIDMPRLGMVINIYADGRVTNHYDEQFETIATAVPVPPHGRLIDADGEIGVNVTMMSGGKCRVDLIAPTIIPAEE